MLLFGRLYVQLFFFSSPLLHCSWLLRLSSLLWCFFFLRVTSVVSLTCSCNYAMRELKCLLLLIFFPSLSCDGLCVYFMTVYVNSFLLTSFSVILQKGEKQQTIKAKSNLYDILFSERKSALRFPHQHNNNKKKKKRMRFERTTLSHLKFVVPVNALTL